MGAPMEAEAYVEMAAAEDRHWWFRGRRRVLRAMISGLHLPADARILEIGAGTGGNLLMLSRFGKVIAVERSATARAFATEKTGARCDIRAGAAPDELPLTGELFDLICLFDVLEHVEQDEETLRAIRPFLAPGGTVLLTVPAFRRLWGPHDAALHHKRRYEKAELRGKLREAGFTIAKLSFINMGLFPLAVLMRVYDRLAKRPGASGTQTPPWLLNEIFAGIFGAEAAVLPALNLPFGLSLLAIAR
jgi:SAM-dependent methyltransferase